MYSTSIAVQLVRFLFTLWNPKVPRLVHKRPLLDPSHLNSVHTPTSFSVRIQSVSVLRCKLILRNERTVGIGQGWPTHALHHVILFGPQATSSFSFVFRLTSCTPHCRCRGLLLQLIKFSDAITPSVGLLWTRDRSVAETSTSQYTTFTLNIHALDGI